MEKTKDAAKKYEKYPLLIMFLDYEEQIGQSDKHYISEASITMVFVAPTDKNYKAQERKEKVFRPVLWPLYEQFMSYLQLSNYFDTDVKGLIPHNKTDRYFYSADETKAQNVFAAYFDAVEITNLELKLMEQGCEGNIIEYVTHNGELVTHNEEAVTWQN